MFELQIFILKPFKNLLCIIISMYNNNSNTSVVYNISNNPTLLNKIRITQDDNEKMNMLFGEDDEVFYFNYERFYKYCDQEFNVRDKPTRFLLALLHHSDLEYVNNEIDVDWNNFGEFFIDNFEAYDWWEDFEDMGEEEYDECQCVCSKHITHRFYLQANYTGGILRTGQDCITKKDWINESISELIQKRKQAKRERICFMKNCNRLHTYNEFKLCEIHYNSLYICNKYDCNNKKDLKYYYCGKHCHYKKKINKHATNMPQKCICQYCGKDYFASVKETWKIMCKTCYAETKSNDPDLFG